MAVACVVLALDTLSMLQHALPPVALLLRDVPLVHETAEAIDLAALEIAEVIRSIVEDPPPEAMRLPVQHLALENGAILVVDEAADAGLALTTHVEQPVPRLVGLGAVSPLAGEELRLVDRLANDLRVGEDIADTERADQLQLLPSAEIKAALQIAVVVNLIVTAGLDPVHQLAVELNVLVERAERWRLLRVL